MGKRWPKAEKPEWKIRPGRKDSREGFRGFSSSVIVNDHNRIGVCKIRFEDSFVEALGHHLSFGVSSQFPVFIRLTRLVDGGAWSIQASYLAFPKRSPEDLWQVEQMPEWAKKVHWYGQ